MCERTLHARLFLGRSWSTVLLLKGWTMAVAENAELLAQCEQHGREASPSCLLCVLIRFMDTDMPEEVNAIYKQLKKQWGQIKQHSEQVSSAQHMGMCRTCGPCGQ